MESTVKQGERETPIGYGKKERGASYTGRETIGLLEEKMQLPFMK